MDAAGHVYVTGDTGDPPPLSFPVKNPVQATYNGATGLSGSNAFVAELNPAGQGANDLVYATYLGGSTSDAGFGIAVGAAGYAYVTGLTTSTDFPTASPLQATKGAGFNSNAFISRLPTRFAPAVHVATDSGADSPGGVVMGDFNGDSFQDLAVLNYNLGSTSTVSVLLSNGDGTFAPAVDYPVEYGPKSVAVGDFNGDGILDLVTVSDVTNTASVLLGNGDGTFQPAVSYNAGPQPESVAVGDFNGDGIPDLVAANSGYNTVSVLVGNGDGSFQSPVAYDSGPYPVAVAAADFNGDGILDLVVANDIYPSGTVGVLLGNGDGSFKHLSKDNKDQKDPWEGSARGRWGNVLLDSGWGGSQDNNQCPWPCTRAL